MVFEFWTSWQKFNPIALDYYWIINEKEQNNWTSKIQKSQIMILVLNPSTLSTIFAIVWNPGCEKIVLFGDSLLIFEVALVLMWISTLLRFPEIQGLLPYFARTAQSCTQIEHYHSTAGSIWIHKIFEIQ